MLPTCIQRARVCSKATILNTFTRSYYKQPFFYEEKYFGIFDKHDHEKYPRKMHPYKEEELLDEVHAIRAIEIKNPSPFHIITRVRGFSNECLPWTQRVTLRRLNIHSSKNGDVVLVPNTPQFNALINKVKHLILLKPALFANGKIPSQEDIGALKVCQHTGTVTVDEKLRMRASRLNLEKPLLFQGNHLRHKINKLTGIGHNHYMR